MRNFIKIYWEVLLVVAAGIAGVILLKVKGEDWPAALNFPTEAVAAGSILCLPRQKDCFSQA